MATEHHHPTHRREDQITSRGPTDAFKSILPEQGPSKSQILALVAGLPAGGFLLLLAGLTLTGTLIGLALATPLFIIFSPILVPAALALGLAVCGFLTSGAFGITALSALSWIVNYLRNFGQLSGQAKQGMHETVGQMGQKAKEMGGQMGQKAKEMGGQMGQKAKEMGGQTQETGRTRATVP